MKKKIGLIIGIMLFIGGLITISLVYYNGDNNQEELEEEVENLGIIKVTDDNFDEEVLKSDKVVVVDFYENMCPPCNLMIPTIINIAKSSDDVKVVMVNISDSNTTTLAEKYEVSATPTIFVLKDGKVEKEFLGATSEDTLMKVVKEQLESKNEE